MSESRELISFLQALQEEEEMQYHEFLHTQSPNGIIQHHKGNERTINAIAESHQPDLKAIATNAPKFKENVPFAKRCELKEDHVKAEAHAEVERRPWMTPKAQRPAMQSKPKMTSPKNIKTPVTSPRKNNVDPGEALYSLQSRMKQTPIRSMLMAHGCCFDFFERGDCSAGNDCKYSHLKPGDARALIMDAEEGIRKKKYYRPPTFETYLPGSQDVICFTFARKGWCIHGDRCWNRHVTPSDALVMTGENRGLSMKPQLQNEKKVFVNDNPIRRMSSSPTRKEFKHGLIQQTPQRQSWPRTVNEPITPVRTNSTLRHSFDPNQNALKSDLKATPTPRGQRMVNGGNMRRNSLFSPLSKFASPTQAITPTPNRKKHIGNTPKQASPPKSHVSRAQTSSNWRANAASPSSPPEMKKLTSPTYVRASNALPPIRKLDFSNYFGTLSLEEKTKMTKTEETKDTGNSSTSGESDDSGSDAVSEGNEVSLASLL